VDKCINEPETANGYQDDDGCPDEVPVEVKKFTGTIKGIVFVKNSDVIRSQSFAILDQAVAVLNEYPDVKLEIQGHTDDTGSDEYNLDLSDRRAASVKTYFVSKGVAEDRLVTKGYGETQPEVENTSKANRSQNRRVVFVLIP
jgi:outer membrane protein OmpA-like peptidoglycan-associated protein